MMWTCTLLCFLHHTDRNQQKNPAVRDSFPFCSEIENSSSSSFSLHPVNPELWVRKDKLTFLLSKVRNFYKLVTVLIDSTHPHDRVLTASSSLTPSLSPHCWSSWLFSSELPQMTQVWLISCSPHPFLPH